MAHDTVWVVTGTGEKGVCYAPFVFSHQPTEAELKQVRQVYGPDVTIGCSECVVDGLE